jgi:hypothetical protein
MAAQLWPIDPPVFSGVVEPYGLFAAARVVDGVTGPRLAGVTYPYRCTPDGGTWPGPCAEVPDGEQKNLPANGQDLIEAYGFAVYAFETCPLVGYTEAELEALARDSLRRTEQHLVERAVWFGRGDYLGLTQRTDVTILAPGPVSPVDAIALGEWWMGRQDGTGVFHINSIGAARLSADDVIWRDGPLWRTPLGHAMSFGGGYGLTGPAGVAAADGAAWMFITRDVTLLRSQMEVRSGLRGQSNEHDSRAERMYVPIIPCPIAAVQVQVLTDGVTVPDLDPAFSLTVSPTQGIAPVTVTAVVNGESGPVDITWGDEA